MASARRHRGPHPKDQSAFGPAAVPGLQRATAELSWLLSRGYVNPSALKLVGDRHALTTRQRKAVERSAVPDALAEGRRDKQLTAHSLRGHRVAVDTFNCVIVLESLLSGAPVFRGRDGALRDVAAVHGTWRRVRETAEALDAVVALLGPASEVRFLLDRPVSNSGRLAGALRERAQAAGLTFEVELDDDPDALLAASDAVVATGDGMILDQCAAWVDLPGAVLAERPDAWLVDLYTDGSATPPGREPPG